MEIAAAARGARPYRAHARGTRGQRGGAAPRRAYPVADQHPARHQARGHRRGGERPRPTTTTPSCRSCRASMRRSRTSSPPPTQHGAVPSCPRFCAWEAGSAATATAILSSPPRSCARRCSMQSKRALTFYLDELHLLGRRAVARRTARRRIDELAALAARSPDPSPHRQDEPYRRAISGIYARLAATASALDQFESPHHAVGDAPPYATRRRAQRRPGNPASFADDERLGACSRAGGCGRCAAPSTSSASISQASTCGRTPMCTSAPSPSCSRSAVRARAMPTLGEGAARGPAAG